MRLQELRAPFAIELQSGGFGDWGWEGEARVWKPAENEGWGHHQSSLPVQQSCVFFFNIPPPKIYTMIAFLRGVIVWVEFL